MYQAFISGAKVTQFSAYALSSGRLLQRAEQMKMWDKSNTDIR